MTELNDGTLTDDCTSLKSVCSTAHEQETVVRKKVVQITDTIVEGVATTYPQSGGNWTPHGTGTGSSGSANAVDCRSCFGRRRADEDSSDDAVVVSGKEEPADVDDGDDIRSNLMANVETSIRTGVSKTPQVAAVIAMAGRRGRRRLGELFLRMSSTVNAERVARVANAARRLEQREIQATIRRSRRRSAWRSSSRSSAACGSDSLPCTSSAAGVRATSVQCRALSMRSSSGSATQTPASTPSLSFFLFSFRL